MTIRIRFEGIRCFSEPQEALIRPITLLVGENSSGKTTFLALCQIAHAIAQGATGDLPFNKPPFSLGAYDQIASYRGGRAGRARSFSLAIEVDDDVHPRSIRQEFVSKNGQPWLQVWRLTSGNLAFQMNEYSIRLEGPRGKTEVPASRPIFDMGQLSGLGWADFVESEIRTTLQGAGALLGEMVLTRSDFESLENALKVIQNEFIGRPYAFAPIRTSPQRT